MNQIEFTLIIQRQYKEVIHNAIMNTHLFSLNVYISILVDTLFCAISAKYGGKKKALMIAVRTKGFQEALGHIYVQPEGSDYSKICHIFIR